MKNKSLISFFLAMLLIVALPSCRNKSSEESSHPSKALESWISLINPDELPEEPSSPVLDMVGILSADDIDIITAQSKELDSLEWAQVAVVIVDDLHGHRGLEYATAIGKKWGVGHKDKNDGIVILVKPKTADSKGEVAIATGFGMKDIISDNTCQRIIDDKMIPKFKDDNYGYGIIYAISLIAKTLSHNKT